MRGKEIEIMSKSKAATLADKVNAAMVGRHPSEGRACAESLAPTVGVGLYWLGTASLYSGLPAASVWQVVKDAREASGKRWARKLGEIEQGHDGMWRAAS